jgi:hypothetical protein
MDRAVHPGTTVSGLRHLDSLALLFTIPWGFVSAPPA